MRYSSGSEAFIEQLMRFLGGVLWRRSILAPLKVSRGRNLWFILAKVNCFCFAVFSLRLAPFPPPTDRQRNRKERKIQLLRTFRRNRRLKSYNSMLIKVTLTKIILLITHFHFQNRVVTKVSKTRVKGVALYTVVQ